MPCLRGQVMSLPARCRGRGASGRGLSRGIVPGIRRHVHARRMSAEGCAL